MREFTGDFHIHTCLSPCASLDMTPRAVVASCLAKGIDIVAITDHNATENIPHVVECARGSALTVLAGMEVTTVEEVHVVALFDTFADIIPLQVAVYANLEGLNDEEMFGVQAIVNANDEVEGLHERLLIGATSLSLNEVVKMIKTHGGIAVAAHVDRPAFSVLSQLGFIDEAMGFDALEIAGISGREAKKLVLSGGPLPLLRSSDAHHPQDIGRRTTRLLLHEASFAAIRFALRSANGCKVMEVFG